MNLSGLRASPSRAPLHRSIRRFDPRRIEFCCQVTAHVRSRRRELLQRRAERQLKIDRGELPDFLPETAPIRSDRSWHVAPIPPDLQRRHVEITGPTERKMLINALNSGADVFMADFEDANSPTWDNLVQGHINLREAIERTIELQTPEKVYRLNEKAALLLVRPRGWHLNEKHVLVDGQPMSGSLFDFGLYFFHNARRLLSKGSGPYFYLPKLESHLEARLWNDVFNLAQDELDLPRGTIKVTVLIETILAAFEMEEILYELRDHIAGLNAGRWDYMFSIIKKFRNRPDFAFPDRAQVTMTSPFMRAYTELLVKTCHQRGAHAIGGMAAFIPSRKDPIVNENALKKVREDKLRESGDGFDGTWVAHPDLVPVAKEIFDGVLGDKPHQKEKLREDVHVARATTDRFHDRRRADHRSGSAAQPQCGAAIRRIVAARHGAVAIYNLMEDAATAEISRAQVWQWINSPNGVLADGRKVTVELVQQLLPEEIEKIRQLYGEANFAASKIPQARKCSRRS